MKEFELIRNYYKPIQPTVKAGNPKIVYHELKPNKETETIVYCFWELKTSKRLDHTFTYKVVSDGCIDIFFEVQKPEGSFIMGFCRKYTEFPIGNSFNYVGIRFLPAAFPSLFNVNAKILSNQSQELKNILPDFSNWISTEIKPFESFDDITNKLNKKLTLIAKQKTLQVDHRFLNSLNIIFKKRGFLDTTKDLDTGLSQRQLRRIFNFYIGTTAKTFSSVVRFQQVLNANPSKLTLKESKLYFDLGFFDQAHFIKSFKTFYGVTPSEAFR